MFRSPEVLMSGVNSLSVSSHHCAVMFILTFSNLLNFNLCFSAVVKLEFFFQP